jgi:mannose-6-phosphate isomerase-like protein (cupin superfamily)
MPGESEAHEPPDMWSRSRPHDRRERLFGGSGAVLVWSLCDSGPRPPFGAVLACELEAAGSVGPHVQQEFAEVLIVVEGQGVARVGGSPMAIQPGVVVELPLGQNQSLANAHRISTSDGILSTPPATRRDFGRDFRRRVCAAVADDPRAEFRRVCGFGSFNHEWIPNRPSLLQKTDRSTAPRALEPARIRGDSACSHRAAFPK